MTLFTEMLQASLRPNVVVHNVLITACEKSMRWESALQLLANLLSSSLKPDLISFSASISACEKGWQWSQALSLYTELRRTGGLQPDVALYSAAISACAKGRQWERALGLRGHMRRDGCRPDLVAHNALLEACVEGTRWREALCVLLDMRQLRTSPGAVSCLSLLEACEAGSADGHTAPALSGMRACLAGLLRQIEEREALGQRRAFGDKANIFGLAAEVEDVLVCHQLVGSGIGKAFSRAVKAPMVAALRRVLPGAGRAPHAELETAALERQFGLGSWSTGCVLDDLGFGPAASAGPPSEKARRQLHAGLLHDESGKHTQGCPRVPVATHLATRFVFALRLGQGTRGAAGRDAGGMRLKNRGAVLGYRGVQLAKEVPR